MMLYLLYCYVIRVECALNQDAEVAKSKIYCTLKCTDSTQKRVHTNVG